MIMCMHLQLMRHTKTFVTNITRVRTLSGMYTYMPLEITPFIERFLTDITQVRAFSSVHTYMPLDSRSFTEELLTYIAWKTTSSMTFMWITIQFSLHATNAFHFVTHVHRLQMEEVFETQIFFHDVNGDFSCEDP